MARHIVFNLHQLLEKIPTAFAQQAVAAHVTITLETDQGLPEYVCGDQSLLYKSLLLIIEHRLQINGRPGAC